MLDSAPSTAPPPAPNCSPSARVSEVLDRLRRNDVRCRSVLGLPDLG
ncbi:hypothetical protein [Streptomyces sp. DH41]|nr:hypothetical protein [Streptomyces sp. DH41]MDG9722837.1 hypothetical protein [Streptomyces sp. DH41]